jgi:hypothetical protein
VLVGVAEPVRSAGVEFRCLARSLCHPSKDLCGNATPPRLWSQARRGGAGVASA